MIVVTGGGGFIGSNIVAALEAGGRRDIVICDRLGTGEKWRNIARRELADIISPGDLFDFLDGHAMRIEAIVHMGAVSSTMESDADHIVASNFCLTMRLWHWCATHGTKLIYASSAATYGSGSNGFVDDASIEALAALRPLNAYGWSKHLTDRRIARLLAEGAPSPPQWAGLKFFNVYGPNEYHKGGQQSLVPQLLRQIEETGTARLFRSYNPDYADGGQLRDFVWVNDVCDVCLWLLDNDDVSGLFNVGTGKARSFADLATAVFASMERDVDIDYVDMPDALIGRYQDFTEASLNGLRGAGYTRPFTSLEDGVASYVTGYLMTEDRYC